jgi:hypothetical protein
VRANHRSVFIWKIRKRVNNMSKEYLVSIKPLKVPLNKAKKSPIKGKKSVPMSYKTQNKRHPDVDTKNRPQAR